MFSAFLSPEKSDLGFTMLDQVNFFHLSSIQALCFSAMIHPKRPHVVKCLDFISVNKGVHLDV